VNFQCSNCGKLIEVEEHFLGQAVHCPHCQQVVQTAAPPEITFTVPPAVDEESIFETTEQAGDALFGNAAPRIEMPTDLHTENVPGETAGGENAPEAAASSGPIFSSTDVPMPGPSAEALHESAVAMSGLPLEPSASRDVGTEVAQDAAASATAGLLPPAHDHEHAVADFTGAGFQPAAALQSGESLGLSADSFPRNLPARALPTGMRSGMFLALVVIPLISYAILSTIAVITLYLRPPQPSLDYLPDVEGDFQGAKRQKHSSISYERLDPDSPLPERLKIDLKHSIRLGDVEVTPLRVEWGRLRIRHPDMTEDVLPGEALLLHLKLKNVSGDVVFSPTDPYFDRQWKSAQDSKPYTFLEVGKQRLYGGPLPWRPGMRADNRPALEGQTYEALPPGAQMETFVCTPPSDAMLAGIVNHQGPLLWRIQVRRGLVHVRESDVPATAVLGVAFQASDIQKQL